MRSPPLDVAASHASEGISAIVVSSCAMTRLLRESDFKDAFREEICPELGIKPTELDAVIFWNYGDILKSLKRSAK